MLLLLKEFVFKNKFTGNVYPSLLVLLLLSLSALDVNSWPMCDSRRQSCTLSLPFGRPQQARLLSLLSDCLFPQWLLSASVAV